MVFSVREGYHFGVYASDHDRERTAASLREHYVRGRLSLDELSDRTERVFAARSRAELRLALAGLPFVPDARELAQHGRSVAAAAVRGFALLALTAVYLLFTLVLVVAVPIALLLHGVSGAELVGLLLLWLVPTVLLSRAWRRGLRRIA